MTTTLKNIKEAHEREQLKNTLEPLAHKEFELASEGKNNIDCWRIKNGNSVSYLTCDMHQPKTLFIRLIAAGDVINLKNDFRSLLSRLQTHYKHCSEINLTLNKTAKVLPKVVGSLGFKIDQEKMPRNRQHLGVSQKTRNCYVLPLKK